MSDTEQTPKLNPVDSETIQRLESLRTTIAVLGEELLRVEEHKAIILRSYSNVRKQERKIYDEMLKARNLPENSRVSIDANTGEISLVE